MVLLKFGKNVLESPDLAHLEEKILRGYDLKCDIQDAKKELTENNAKFIEFATALNETCTLSTQSLINEYHCRMSKQIKCEIFNPSELRRIIPDRFNDLVEISVTYKPSKQLIKSFREGRFKSCIREDVKWMVSYNKTEGRN